MPQQSSNWIVLVLLSSLLFGSRMHGCVPGPGPETPPKPSQVCLLIVEEASTRTVQQAAIYGSRELREWCASRGHLLRIVDQDATGPGGEPASVLQPYRVWRSGAANQSVTLPVALLVLADGSVYLGGPLPGSAGGVVEWVRANTAAE